jgi:hypothetical protein
MKNDFSAMWYILCDIVVELTLCHMAYGKVTVATDSDQSPITVTGSTSKKKIFIFTNTGNCRSQFPRGIRRWSAASRLLGLRVRIPLGGMDVSVL